MAIRAKMKCLSVTTFEGGETIKCMPVVGTGDASDENKTWSKYSLTPSGAPS